ncbi:CNP1-like family protein [Aquabacterium sp. A08]|uniref:CNP1-like family protein n=1 Tax=Aquabacterium sp. A08 TaxID=2718532 RepID=UPI0014247A1E|nr:CNP1-like family protein [Aquabacterium sp. A08]NIC40270.1 hypothetical protein [Aquabacterium sp. A08]
MTLPTLTRALGAAALLGAAACAHAQTFEEAPVWQEAEVAEAPTFDSARLLGFQVSTGSELRYGIDPNTLSIGPDAVVRYVMVASSPSGAVNALYEGLRCATAEVKTYARWAPASGEQPGQWRLASGAEWRKLYANHASRPALVLARSGLCDGPTPNAPVARMLRDLRQGRSDR